MVGDFAIHRSKLFLIGVRQQIKQSLGIVAQIVGQRIGGEISNQNDPDFEGALNAGAYIDMSYRAPNAPLFATVRGSFGDLTGFDMMFGFVF
jgi:hypothetical protein